MASRMKRTVIMSAEEYDRVMVLLHDALTSQNIGLKYCRNTFLAETKDRIERALDIMECEDCEKE